MTANREDDEKVKLAIEARGNSVKQLCELYRVVISIAVGLAFHKLIDANLQPVPLVSGRVALFLAFIFTVIPFFHGAVRHLYATYIEGGGSSRVVNWVVLVDYYLLFLEGGLFVGLACAFESPQSFGFLLTGILALDVVWGAMSRIGFGGTDAQRAEVSWAAINAVTVVVLLVVMIADPILRHWGLGDTQFKLFLLLLAVVRTGTDYYKNHTFYCPPYPTRKGETGGPGA